MIELLQAAVAWVNLPLSFLLGLVILYWVGVIVGVTGEGHAHHDVDLDGDLDGAADGHGALHGAFQTLLSFLCVGDLPLMLIISIFAVCAWTLGVLSYHFVTHDSIWMGILMYLPILLVGALVTRFSALLLLKIYRKVDGQQPVPESAVGHVCVLLDDCSPSRLAQGEVQVEGAPFRVTVKTHSDTLKKGTRALVLEKDEARDCYFVEAFD